MRKIYTGWIILVMMSSSASWLRANEDDSYEKLRFEMVEHVRSRGIMDSLTLQAMCKVPRHHFVSDEWQHQAYNDHPLPIGFSQTISQPYLVAYMTEQLNLKGGEKVLEVGTGSGYQAAMLAEIADSVFTIEIIDSLSLHAQHILQQEGYANVFCKIGDGYDGWPEQAPFDRIIVTAAPNAVPQPLLDQLKCGGRMIIPLGGFWQNLYLITKDDAGQITQKSILPVRFVPMRGKAKEE